MLVEAIRLGYYGLKRIREGQQFKLQSEKHFSDIWMKKVGPKKSESGDVVLGEDRGAKKKAPKFVDTTTPEAEESDVI